MYKILSARWFMSGVDVGSLTVYYWSMEDFDGGRGRPLELWSLRKNYGDQWLPGSVSISSSSSFRVRDYPKMYIVYSG